MSARSSGRISHPAWCVGLQCTEDHAGGHLRDVIHRTQPSTWRGMDSLVADVYLTRVDKIDGDRFRGEPDEFSVAYLNLGGAGTASPDELENLAAWLVARAGEYRQAIANEGGAL